MSVIKKGLIGIEDLNIGSGTFSRSTSTGGSVTLTKINFGVVTTFTPTSSTPVTATVATLMLINASGGNKVVNLPNAASAVVGSVICVKKTDSSANTVTINAAGGDGIDDGTSFLLSLQNEFTFLVSDGVSKWWVIG